jgi:hypothetical protein
MDRTAMPEATIDKDDDFLPRKNYVRFSYKLAIEAVTKAVGPACPTES